MAVAWLPEYDDLVRRAREVIAARHRPDWHHVGAAVLTRSGRVFVGVHLEAYVGRVAVCGEAVALGAAATAGDTDVAAVAAVYHDGSVVTPCGMCRELLADYAPECVVLVGEREAVRLADLIPRKYVRTAPGPMAEPGAAPDRRGM
jgi:cytidine deaminase